MKAISLRRPGSLMDLQTSDCDVPLPGPGQVRVKNVAASINPVDYKMMLSGLAAWKYPHIPGVDGAGYVDLIGQDCPETVYLGQAVAYHADIRHDGTFAEYTIVPHHVLAPIPQGLSPLHAAALPCAGLTAHQALFRKAHVTPGQTVLVVGAAGGVGSFAVQLAHNLGARVIGTCSPENNDYVSSLGASDIIDYNTQGTKERVMEITQGRGADVIIESVSSHSATQALGSLAYGGHLVCLSGLPDMNKLQQFTVSPSIHEIALGAAYGHGNLQDQEYLAKALVELMNMVKDSALKVHINRVIELDDLSQALEDLRDRHVKGKIVIQIAEFE